MNNGNPRALNTIFNMADVIHGAARRIRPLLIYEACYEVNGAYVLVCIKDYNVLES